MRATRFRLSAGCLSWDSKDGTAAKNQRIRDAIPARYKDPAVNSTKGWRDLDKAEIKKIKEGAMRKPQQGPKAKRAAQKENDRVEEHNTVEDHVEQEDFIDDGEQDEYKDYIGASDKQNDSTWLDHDWEDPEISKPAPFRRYTNPHLGRLTPKGGYIPPSQAVTKQNLAGVQMELKRLDSRKRSRSPLDADSDEYQTRAPKRVRTTAEAQTLGSEGGFSRVRNAKMGRQQPRGPAGSPYAVQGTSPLTAYEGIGGNFDGHDAHPSASGGSLEFPFPAPHGNGGGFYDSNSRANAGLLMPNTYSSNTQYGSAGLSQSQFPQNRSYQVPQPRSRRGKYSDSHAELGVFQVDTANNRSFGPHHLRHNVNSGLELQNEVEDYAPVSRRQIAPSAEYESPVYEPGQIRPFYHGPTQHEAPLPQPTGRKNLPQNPPGSKTTGKDTPANQHQLQHRLQHLSASQNQDPEPRSSLLQ